VTAQTYRLTQPNLPQTAGIAARGMLQAGWARLAAVAIAALSSRYALPPTADGKEQPYDEATAVAISLLCSVHF